MTVNNNTTSNFNLAIERAEAELICPVTQSYMNVPITLVPCAHRISEVAFKELEKSNQTKKCPTCRTHFEKGIPDLPFKNMLLDIIGLLNPNKKKEIEETIEKEDTWIVSALEPSHFNSQNMNVKIKAIDEQCIALIKLAPEIPAKNPQEVSKGHKKFLDALDWLEKINCPVSTKTLRNYIAYFAYCVSVQKGKIGQFPGRDDWGDYAIKTNLLDAATYKEVLTKAYTLYTLDLCIHLQHSQDKDALSQISKDQFFTGKFSEIAFGLFRIRDMKELLALNPILLTTLKEELRKEWGLPQHNNNNNNANNNGKSEVSNDGKSEISIHEIPHMYMNTYLGSVFNFIAHVLTPQLRGGLVQVLKELDGKKVLGFDATIFHQMMWHFTYFGGVQKGIVTKNPGRDDWGQVALETPQELSNVPNLSINDLLRVLYRAYAITQLNFYKHLVENDRIAELKQIQQFKLHQFDRYPNTSSTFRDLAKSLLENIPQQFLNSSSSVGTNSIHVTLEFLTSSQTKQSKIDFLNTVIQQCKAVWEKLD